MDIKPANITIIGDINDLSKYEPKIIGFGLSRYAANINKFRGGILGYMAPEMEEFIYEEIIRLKKYKL